MTVGELRKKLANFPDEMEVTGLEDLRDAEQAEYDIASVRANSIPKGTVFLQLYRRN